MRRKARSPGKRECRKMFAALSEYVDGDLDPVFCKELEKHMRGCEPCEAFLATLRKTVELCGDYQPPPSAKPKVPAAVKRQIKAAYDEFASKKNHGSHTP
jgi:RNA polymerase sigma-70 factor (ECF subfamily)